MVQTITMDFEKERPDIFSDKYIETPWVIIDLILRINICLNLCVIN